MTNFNECNCGAGKIVECSASRRAENRRRVANHDNSIDYPYMDVTKDPSNVDAWTMRTLNLDYQFELGVL